uniref:Gibberellin-regulated protein 6-like n=1 Tax=Rhizophora mucronata TaxID=61149 RepID=A0A2P2NHI3_RHIMU
MVMEVTITTIRIVSDQGVSRATNAHHNARGGAARPSTTSPACSSAKSAAQSVCACPQGIMGIRPCALATTIGRPRKEDPNALDQLHNLPSKSTTQLITTLWCFNCHCHSNLLALTI